MTSLSPTTSVESNILLPFFFNCYKFKYISGIPNGQRKKGTKVFPLLYLHYGVRMLFFTKSVDEIGESYTYDLLQVNS